jgi:iron(III) transport system permease protein
VLGASVAVGASFLIAFVMLRTRLPGRGLVEYVLFLPFALPSIVLAVGVLWGYVSFPISVYGTLWILGIGYVTKFLPYGLRSVSGSLLQINRELEEAARISGAGLATLLRRVVLPLALPGLVAGWCLLVVVFMREFSMSLVLWSSGSEVVTVLFWDYWTNGRWGQLGALGTLLTIASLAIVFGVRRTARLDAVAT